MGFWHWEICREKEQLMNRKGKILFLYREVKRLQSLSNSFGCHSPPHSVWPESKLRTFPPEPVLFPGFTTSGKGPHRPAHYSTCNNDIIPNTSLNLLHAHPVYQQELSALPPEYIRIRYFSPSLCHRVKARRQHGQPPLLQSRPQPAPLLFLLLLTIPASSPDGC